MVSLVNRCANLQDNVFRNSAQLVDHGRYLHQVTGRRNNQRFDPTKATLKVAAVPSPFDASVEDPRAITPLFPPSTYLQEPFEGAANANSARYDLSGCLTRRPSSSLSSQAGEGLEQALVAACHSSEVVTNNCQTTVDRAQLIEANARRLGLLAGTVGPAASAESDGDSSEADENGDPPSAEPPPTPSSARSATPSSLRSRPRSRPTSAAAGEKIVLRHPAAAPSAVSTLASRASTKESRPSTPSLPYPWPRPPSARSAPTANRPPSRPVSAGSMSARCSVLIDTACRHRKVFKAHCSETSHLRNEVDIELMMQSRLPSCRAQSARAHRTPVRSGLDLAHT